MALICSLTSGGADIGTTKIDLGNINVGAESSQDLFLRNSYNNKITDLTIFFAETDSSNYDGDFASNTDFSELIGWGDNASTDGAFLNQNASSPSWTQLKTGNLDSQANGVLLSTTSGVANQGEIAGGQSEEAHIQIKVHVPDGEDTGGTRNFDIAFSYYYTS